jgi:hypothetical protein
MRPKVVITVLLLAFGLLGVVALLSTVLRQERVSRSAAGGDFSAAGSAPRLGLQDQERENSPSAKVDQVGKSGPRGPETVNSIVHNNATDKVIANSQSSAALQNTNHAEYVSQRIDELNDLAMNDDSNSLNTILTELTNSDKQIREGALGAVIQFGDRSAISTLRELAVQTEDLAEKADILAAIDFLKLPSVFEVPTLQKTASGTAGTALPQKNGIGEAPVSRNQSTLEQ